MAEERPWLAVAILAGLFATSAAFWQEAARRPARVADGLDAVRWTVWTPAAVPVAEVPPLQSDADGTDAAAGTDRRAVRVPRRTDEAAGFESVGQPAVLPASAPSYRPVAVRRATVTRAVDVLSSTADHDQAVLASTRLVLSAPTAAAPDRAPVVPRTEDGNWSDGAATATARAMSTAGKAIGKAFRIAGAKIGG